MKITISALETKSQNPNYPEVTDVLPAEVLEKATELRLIDVRQPDEYDGELGHIKGAELIPLGTLPQKLSELSKEETIIFICRSGNRSAQAANFAIENGFSEVANMAGGMISWNENSFEITKED